MRETLKLRERMQMEKVSEIRVSQGSFNAQTYDMRSRVSISNNGIRCARLTGYELTDLRSVLFKCLNRWFKVEHDTRISNFECSSGIIRGEVYHRRFLYDTHIEIFKGEHSIFFTTDKRNAESLYRVVNQTYLEMPFVNLFKVQGGVN